MRTLDREGNFVVEDSPGLHWLLGALFVFVGLITMSVSVGLFSNGSPSGWLEGGASFAMGTCGLAAGVWTLSRAPYSRLQVRRGTGQLCVTRFGIKGRSMEVWPISDVAAVQIIEKEDDEGSAIFQIHLTLRDGRSVPVSNLWTHGRDVAIGVAEKLGRAVGPSIAVVSNR